MSHDVSPSAQRRSTLRGSIAVAVGALVGALVGLTLSASASASDGHQGTGYGGNAGRLRVERIELDDGSGWRVQGSGYLAGSTVTVAVAGVTLSATADEHGVVDVVVSDDNPSDDDHAGAQASGTGSDGNQRTLTTGVDAGRDDSGPASTALGWAAAGAAVPLIGRLRAR